MFVEKLFEYVMGALIVLVLITQVVIPLWNKKPIFPFFGKTAKLEDKLGSVEEEGLSLSVGERILKEKARQEKRKTKQ